ncbi:MAG: hypothetical protein WCR45_06395 [Bacteroidaceae bacterium]
MSNNEVKELSIKLRRGLKIAEQRMLEKEARHGNMVSQGTPDGKVIYVSAEKLLNRLKQQDQDSLY